MVTFLAVLHIIITISLIFLVLIQDSKGGGMGAFGGAGNSNTVLGASGATNLAAKITQWLAIAFGLSCILLAISTGRSKKSVVDEMPPLPPPTEMSAGVSADADKKPEAVKTDTSKDQKPTEKNTTSEQKSPTK